MIPALWSANVFGGVAMVTEEAIVTAPRFGDGDWRGGWWAKYERATGHCVWKKKHRRGAELFDRSGDVIFATTHKYSGVYAISLHSGARLWSRLGDRFDWMLRVFDLLPCDNEGDAPARVWNGGLLTRSGRLLSPVSGAVLSRHRLEYSKSPPGTLLSIDGERVAPSSTLRKRESIALHAGQPAYVNEILKNEGLGLAGILPCVVCAHGLTICLACRPHPQFIDQAQSRLSVHGSKEEVPHCLVVIDTDRLAMVEQFPIGSFLTGEIDWADGELLSVTTQSRRQWDWSYERQMWLVEWTALTSTRTVR